jgi:2-polyprenyl-6-methoxyphenol hydroxylase-like FAD-dependent oxidoreductase
MDQPRRPLPETTPQGIGSMTFFHPHMQETLIQVAADAGAEVVRGASVRDVKPGEAPTVTLEHGGATYEVRCRMVVGTDGRNSPLRKSCGFEERSNPRFLQIGGLLFEDIDIDDTAMHLWWDIDTLRGAYIFPQGKGRARVYASTRVDDAEGKFSGERDIARFIDMVGSVSRRPDALRGARPAGPLATFEGTESWVAHPYRDGVALLGDAAATSDPSWGQGLGITLRTVRELRDQLVANDDWDAAGHRYAENVDRFFGKLLEVEDWFSHLFYDRGQEAGERRGRALESWTREPERANDLFMSGPDAVDVSEASRRRFFGED